MPKSKFEPVVLTDIKVKALKSDPAGEYVQGDLQVPGFGVRVRPTGTPTYIIYKRLPGAASAKRVVLGRVGEISLKDARDKARETAAAIRSGVDVSREKRLGVARAIAERRHDSKIEREIGYAVGSFGEMASRYIAQECGALRRGGEIAATIRRGLLPTWGMSPLADLRRRDLTFVLDPVIASGRIQAAHKLREVAIRIINFAVDRGDLDVNFLASPSRGRKRTGILRRSQRSRVLDDAEIRGVWGGCDVVGDPFGAIVRLLLMLGQRRDEVAAMEWAELDLAAGIWVIPATRYKAGIEHIVPLPPPAVDLLRSLPKVCEEFVFSTQPTTHFSGFSKSKARLDDLSGTADWRLHDLRRTARTGLSGLKIAPDIAERVLGHVIGGVRGVYDRYAFFEEKRDALERWTTHLLGIVAPSPDDRVVQMARHA